MATRKTIVTIEFSKPGIQPPLYLAGSFSDPAWQPKQMESTVSKDNEYHFHTEVEVEGGSQYQYKFRVGEGDLWILNEDAPTVTDDQGNRNNLLAVALNQKPSAKDAHQQGVTGETSNQRKTEVGGAVQQPRPTLIVEKADAELRHGDDFGDKATADQREAHRMRSLDAEPDQVIVSGTAEAYSANTAAEVADVASFLDIQEPTPPITDAEAGRIGFRRLSQTPITDVAAVASEVSDSAALLDDDEHVLRIEMPPSFNINGTNTEGQTPGSGEVTPWEDRVPLFAHECVELPQPGEQLVQPPDQHKQSPKEDEGSIDLDDPTLEDFPCERHLILEQVRTSATRLSQDETIFEGASSEPIGTIAHRSERSDSSSSPGRVAGEARTPSLDSIPEEHAYAGETSFVLPSAMRKKHDRSKSESLPEVSDTEKEEPRTTVEAYEPNSAALLPGAELTHNTVPARTSTEMNIQGITCESQSSGQPHPDSETLGVGQTMDGANADGYGERELPGKWPVVDNASSGSNMKAQAALVTDSASSSAVEGSSDTSQSQLKHRKSTSVSPAPERPLTPSSMRSANFVAQSRNLLKNFLKMIFVDWIGGMIKRLCGRGRRT